MLSDQIMRLFEDKTFDHGPAAADLGFSPLDFRAGLRRQLALMGRLKA